ncbi:MAG: GNAT family N-acetyltransferase, partial [Candidatus Omnitrophica bacterium]|nr:GNAT family N-acetyltransferase [Candidatus Omnitrophota bacterium]
TTRESVRVLGLEDTGEWRAALEQIPGGCEPFFLPEFYRVAADHAHAQAECFVFEEDGSLAVYPYLRRRLSALPFIPGNSLLCDLTGGYGYNGAVSTSGDVEFARRFREAFCNHCETSHVVTEFVRFHPLLGNAKLFAGDCTITLENQNVALDLRRPLEEIRSSYEHSCRKNLKKARREGVSTFVEEGVGASFEEFLRLYDGTMVRVGAGRAYRFERSYLEGLARRLSPAPVFVYAQWRGRIVSCEMALRSGQIIYSYLGGTEADAFPVRPNNALKDALIGWAHEAGCKWYLIGGGLKPGDDIFRYKRTLAPDGVIPFHIGRRIYDPPAYEDVISRWQAARAPRAADRTRLQCYWE